MKKISTFELIPGMILGDDVLNFDHQIILSKGTELTDTLISRIELYGVLEVYIDDSNPSDSADDTIGSISLSDLLSDLEAEEKGSSKAEEKPAPAAKAATSEPTPPPPAGSYADYAPKMPTYSERIKATPEFKEFKQEYDNITESFSFKLNEMVDKNVSIDPGELLEEPLSLIRASGSSSNTLDMLHNMRDYDDLTYAHCLNVALLNYVAAGWLHWSEEDKEMAMACGLLHDIGKLKVVHSILTKPAKLNNEEYQQIQKHTIDGYKILNKLGVDENIQNAALMHHERYDGSGYPLRLSGPRINKFARLTAISDVYDAMTAARVYRGPLCPFRVIEIFEEEGFEKYDAEFILSFLSNVGATYVRNACRLNDGREGEIIMLNKEKLSRPVVQCGYEYVDLMKHPDLRIDTLL